ncbi:MAG: hypothetical protein IMZ46_12590, partial [Acidobacteria bacterium]|nr:hypothetical protein [Acidobacteriota bacterium]
MATAWGTEGVPRMMPQYVLRGCEETDSPLEVIEVSPDPNDDDGWVALHLVGAFHGISAMISIDGHPMWVFASDGGYVRPRRVEAVPLSNGERASVFIQVKEAGDFTFRVAATTDPQVIAGFATLRVRIEAREGDEDRPSSYIVERQEGDEDRSTPYIDDAGNPLSDSVAIFDPNVAKPFPESPSPQLADETLILHMGNAAPPYLWALNYTPLAAEDIDNEPPLLLQPRMSRDHIAGTQNGSWVDLVLIPYTSPNPSHPLH